VRCHADPACPFPPAPGSDYCRQHAADRRLELTLHETNDRVRRLEEVQFPYMGFSDHAQKGWGKKGRPPLNGKKRMTEEERRARYANTYCMARLPDGRLCQEPIPLRERVCEACRERLLPAKKNEKAP